MLAGDADRDRAATELREHYARGRLSLDDYTQRVERALSARSRGDLRVALSGLASWPDTRGLMHTAARGAALVVFSGLYVLFTLVLLLVLAVTLLLHGASTSELLAFLAVWLVPTYLLSRLWHRPRRHT